MIINQSLLTGIFPEKLKIAKVSPFFKKDDITIMDNYRPVSLLTATSKVFEKLLTYNCMIISIKTICFTVASMGSVKYTLPSWQD